MVPAQTPACMAPMRRKTRGSVGHGRACQRLVIREGTINSAAAWAGAMTSASMAIEMVGKPRPTTPLTTPASMNTDRVIAINAGVPPGSRSGKLMLARSGR